MNAQMPNALNTHMFAPFKHSRAFGAHLAPGFAPKLAPKMLFKLMVEAFQDDKEDYGSSVMADFMESNALYSGIQGVVAAKAEWSKKN